MGFLWPGLIGFGGALPLARSMLVERRRWLSGEQSSQSCSGCASFCPAATCPHLSVAVGMGCGRGALCACWARARARRRGGLGVVYMPSRRSARAACVRRAGAATAGCCDRDDQDAAAAAR
ncbi:hypothetical protein M8494_11700 [Serratia ureilytica]